MRAVFQDNTRVVLSTVDGEPSSHYINANFIAFPGLPNPFYFICAQGPLSNTVDDFWFVP